MGSDRATPTPTAATDVVYVALGASDAVGVGAQDPSTQGYVPLLTARLRQRFPTVDYNLGISAITLDPALSAELPLALSDQPTLVTVWLAVNDLVGCVPLSAYVADLDSLLGQLQSRTPAHVFVADVPDLTLLPAFTHGVPGAGACVQGITATQARVLIGQWNAAIRAAVTQYGAVLVDLYQSDLVAHPEYVSADGFHPSAAGYARLADLFWAQMQAHGGLPAA